MRTFLLSFVLSSKVAIAQECDWMQLPITGDIDLSARSGILPTLVSYPPPSMTAQPFINLTSARAPQPFLDSIAWSNDTCREVLSTPFSNEDKLSLLTAPFTLSVEALPYTGLVLLGPSDVDDAGSEYVAYSTPTWNDSYYNNVRNAMTAQGMNGTGCNDPSFFFRAARKARLSTGNLEEASCQTFSSQFVTDYNSLPTNLTGNEQSYIEFCNTYGFYWPRFLYFGYVESGFEVLDNSGQKTTYYLGYSGKVYNTSADCSTPVLTYYSALGWNELLDTSSSNGNVTFSDTIRKNFQSFYDKYPVSSELLPSTQELRRTQLFTYEAPPSEACVGPPPGAPTSSTTNLIPGALKMILSLVIVMLAM